MSMWIKLEAGVRSMCERHVVIGPGCRYKHVDLFVTRLRMSGSQGENEVVHACLKQVSLYVAVGCTGSGSAHALAMR